METRRAAAPSRARPDLRIHSKEFECRYQLRGDSETRASGLPAPHVVVVSAAVRVGLRACEADAGARWRNRSLTDGVSRVLAAAQQRIARDFRAARAAGDRATPANRHRVRSFAVCCFRGVQTYCSVLSDSTYTDDHGPSWFIAQSPGSLAQSDAAAANACGPARDGPIARFSRQIACVGAISWSYERARSLAHAYDDAQTASSVQTTGLRTCV